MYVLIPGTCECHLTQQEKKRNPKLSSVIKLKNLRWGY